MQFASGDATHKYTEKPIAGNPTEDSSFASLWTTSAAGAILILAGSAYVMSLKDKLSMEKAVLGPEASQKKQLDKKNGV